MSLVELIEHAGVNYAIFIKADVQTELGTQFVTDSKSNLQLGLIARDKFHSIAPHKHLAIERNIQGTNECIIVRSGKIEVDLYNLTAKKIRTISMLTGDVLLLSFGGHGIRFLEKSSLLEVKQGPHVLGEKVSIFEG